MADIYLHAKLAKEVIGSMDYDFNEPLVCNAAQGPDPLYYNFFHKEHASYRYMADRMHDTTTNLLFQNMIHYVKNNLTKDTYSFLVGFICHYALDVKIHPYIYYNVGVYKKDIPETHQYRGLHLKFERSVDAVLMERDLRYSARKMDLLKQHFPLKTIPASVLGILDYVLQETYQQFDGGNMYQVSTIEMSKILKRFVKDQTGIKKLIFKLLDLFNHKQDLFYQDMSLFAHIEQYDYLNLQKNAWHHPVTNQEYHYSVIELYDQAVIFAKDLIEKTNAYIWENQDIDLNTVFTNLSFNSGLPCDHKEPMKYFSNYRKKAT
ncbi:MAG: zinc dependent phospholipase C family protein [Firmicutes bacterium]|nr:zinc dependent phospholipase C family protein [Bacillota bacterium]